VDQVIITNASWVAGPNIGLQPKSPRCARSTESTWTAIGKPLQMAYTLPHFMGYRFALFNYATKTEGGFVDFDYFRVSVKRTGAV